MTDKKYNKLLQIRELLNGPGTNEINGIQNMRKTLSNFEITNPDKFKEYVSMEPHRRMQQGYPVEEVKVSDTAESSRKNAEARAEMFGVDTEQIKDEVNERGTLQSLFALLNTGERTPAALSKETAIANNYRSQNIKMIEDLLAKQNDIKKQLGDNKFSDIFKNPETDRVNPGEILPNIMDYFASARNYERPESDKRIKQIEDVLAELKTQYAEEGEDVSQYSSMAEAVKAAAKNDPGPYQDKFWEDILKDINPLGELPTGFTEANQEKRAKLEELENSYTSDGKVDILKQFEANKEAFKIGGINPEAHPEWMEQLFGTPNTIAGLYMGVALDPFPEVMGLGASRAVARPLSKIWKATGLGGKIAGTGFGKTMRMWGKALSFNKDPVTRMIREEQELLTQQGIEITDELRPFTDMVAKGDQKYKVVANSIADYIDTPPWKVQDVYHDIKEIRVKKKKIMKLITETVGDTVEVSKLNGIEKKLDAIEERLGKWYQKIEDSVKTNMKTSITIGEFDGDSYEQILRKWVKSKGGVKTEYIKVLGKSKIAGEYLDIPKYLRKANGVPADELAASLKVELPQLADALKIDGDDALRQAMKKKVKKLDIDNLKTKDYQDMLADAVAEDLEKNSAYISKYGKPPDDSLSKLVMTKEDLEEMRNIQLSKVDTDVFDTPIMDKGTGKEVTKKVYEDVLEEVEVIKKIKEVKKFRQGIKDKELQPIVDFLQGKLKEAGVNDLGEGYLKENYIPYRANPEDIVYPNPTAKSALDEISPAKPVYEHQRKFHTLRQRKAFGKIHTNRDAFKLTFQRLMEGKRAESRARVVQSLKEVAEEFRTGVKAVAPDSTKATTKTAPSKVKADVIFKDTPSSVKDLQTKVADPIADITEQTAKAEPFDGEAFVRYADDVTEADMDSAAKWTRLNDPELKDFMMPKEYAEVMERQLKFAMMDEPTQWIMNKFDKSLHILKGYMTVANMGFHMRNFYSNFWHLYLKDGMGAFDPIQHGIADRIMFAKFHPDELITVGNKTMTADKWLDAAIDVRQGGIYNRGFIRADQAALLNQQLELMQMSRGQRIRSKFNPASREFFILKTGDAVGGYIENHARLVGWLNDVEKGLDFKKAGINTKHFMIDYGDLSTFEKNIGRRGLPFYSWLRKNSELEIEQLFKQPKKFSMIPKLRNYVEALDDDDLPPDEYVYEYLKDMYAVKMPFDVGGEDVYYNLDFPFQDLAMWANIPMGLKDPNKLLDFVNEFASMANPMLKVPAEMAFNKELFFDKEIRGNSLTEANPLAQMLNIGKAGTDGARYLSEKQDYLMRQIPFLSNLGKINPLEEWEGGEKGRTQTKRTTDLLSAWAGLKFFPYDEEKGKISYERKLLSAINQEITNQNTLDEGSIPEQNKIASALKSLYETQISEETGMDDIRSIEDMFRVTGGKTSEMSLMLQLMKEPYKEKAEKISGKTLSELMDFFESEGYNYTEEQVRELIGQ